MGTPKPELGSRNTLPTQGQPEPGLPEEQVQGTQGALPMLSNTVPKISYTPHCNKTTEKARKKMKLPSHAAEE